MTAPIRPIYLSIRMEENPKDKSQSPQLCGFDPISKIEESFSLCPGKKTANLNAFKAWCKGDAKNPRIVLIVHQEAQKCRQILDKLPKSWQVYDTESVAPKNLSELKKQYNITNLNDAPAIHQVVSCMAQPSDMEKVYELFFKQDPEKKLLEMLKEPILAPMPAIHVAALVSVLPEEPLKLTDCYFQLDTIDTFDYKQRIIKLSAYMPSRIGEDAFFIKDVNPEDALMNDLKAKPKLRSILSQFIAWVDSGENQGRIMLFSYSTAMNSEKILKDEATRTRVTLPTQWAIHDLAQILKQQYPQEPDPALEPAQLSKRCKLAKKESELETIADVIHAISNNFLQGVAKVKPLSEYFPAQLPQDDSNPDEVSVYNDHEMKDIPMLEIEDQI